MNNIKSGMYGFICKDGDSEWWVRRKEKGKSKVMITKESPERVIESDLSYVVSHHCRCPQEVKEIGKKLIAYM